MDVYIREGDKFGRVGIRNQFSQVYVNALEIVSKITATSALHLLFWIIANMNDNNIIKLRKDEKLSFMAECRNNSGSNYSLSAVNKAIKSLQEEKILISHNFTKERSGRYMVNPVYFWKSNNQTERKEFAGEMFKIIKSRENEGNKI